MTALTRRMSLAGATALCCLVPRSRRAAAQAYPDRPVRLLVGGAPGSVPDTLARVIADRLAMTLKQPVIVENKPGAAGSIAIGAMLAAQPDGHTLALATMSQAVFNSYLFSKLAYDPLRDFAPVSLLATGAMAVAAHPAFPANTFRGLSISRRHNLAGSCSAPRQSDRPLTFFAISWFARRASMSRSFPIRRALRE